MSREKSQVYERNRKAIIERNSKVLKVTLIGTISVIIFQFVNCLLYDHNAYEIPFYLSIVCVLLGLFAFTCTFSITRKVTFFYLTEVILVIYCAITSAMMWPDSVGIEVLAVLVVFPIVFIDKAWRINLVTTVLAFFYLFVIQFHKVPALLNDEMVDVFGFTFIGCLIGSYIRKNQLEGMELVEQVRISEEQYRLVLTHSGSMMCRYDVTEKSITMSNEVAAYFNVENKLVNVPEEQIHQGLVTAATAESCISFFDGINQGGKCGMASFCLRTKSGFRWMNAKYTTLFSADDKPIYAVLSLMDVTRQREKAEAERVKMETDSLTGALNRATFKEQLQKALYSNASGSHALLLLDIDYFKIVNDSLGHQEGDFVLQKLTNDMKSILRSEDLIGRVGGDEFMIFLQDITPDNANHRAKSICKDLYRQLTPDIHVSVSIGIAIYPKHGVNFEEMYHNADIALYMAKEKGRDGYVVYDESMKNSGFTPCSTPIESNKKSTSV